jgi:transcriptional regulator with XRE-family HTH domain
MRSHMRDTQTGTSTPANGLRAWRERAGFKLEESADLLGMSASMLSRLERGERRVRPKDRVRFARLLGARVRDIFPGV